MSQLDERYAMIGRRAVLAGIAAIPGAAGVAVQNQTACDHVPATRIATWLFADLATVSPDPSARQLWTAGYHAVGTGAAGYALDDSQAPLSRTGTAMLAALAENGRSADDLALARTELLALEARFRVRLADGRWFTLAERNPDASHFGAIGGALYDEGNGIFSGPDDTDAIQALIDWHLFWHPASASNISIGPGTFRLVRPLLVGRNTSYHSVRLEGAGPAYAAGANGTMLLVDHVDGPAIALTGILQGGVNGIGITGRLHRHIVHQRLATLDGPADDIDITRWSDPALPETGERRYSPYAGIAIDPFRGDRPDQGYPPIGVAAWLASGDLYGAAFSTSELSLTQIAVRGFNTGFVIQPCASDGNGDFVRFRDCTVRQCIHGWSVGNSQSRAVEISAATAAQLFCVLTTATHGARNGALQSRIDHLSVGESIRIFNFSNGLSTVGPLTFVNLYLEAGWQLGTLGPGSDVDPALAFEDAKFSFDLIRRHGPPRALMGTESNIGYGPGGARAPIRFNRCRFSGFGPVLTLMSNQVKMTDCMSDSAGLSSLSSAVAAALNTSAGGLITAELSWPADGRGLRHISFTSAGTTTTGVSESVGIYAEPSNILSFDKAGLATSQIDGTAWRFVIASRAALPATIGATILDLTSGSVFVVETAPPPERVGEVIARWLNPAAGDPTIPVFDPLRGQIRIGLPR